MTPADALRQAADALDNYVISERQAMLVELMALHIMRLDGSPRAEREARLLMRLLDQG